MYCYLMRLRKVHCSDKNMIEKIEQINPLTLTARSVLFRIIDSNTDSSLLFYETSHATIPHILVSILRFT
jgi:hypothetical protein